MLLPPPSSTRPAPLFPDPTLFRSVLHPDGCEIDQYFRRVPLLEQVLREFPQVQVVISSSWGQAHPLDQLREFFCEGIKPRIIDVTRDGDRKSTRLNSSH